MCVAPKRFTIEGTDLAGSAVETVPFMEVDTKDQVLDAVQGARPS